MKKNLLLAIAIPFALTMVGCGNATPKENKNDNTEVQQPETEVVEVQEEVKEPVFPWDFPEGIKNEDLEEDQSALSIHTFYPKKLQESDNPANETYIFYNTTVKSVGETTSMVSDFGSEVEMPNALIIPLPGGQKAKKGDILLTWWQSGSGMERAIVTDASNPESPKVDYLDLSYKDDGTGFAQDHANEQIKPNTFTVLKDGEWQPGAQIVVTGDGSYEAGVLINCTDDKVLLKGFAGKIKVFKRSACKVVPLKQNLKAGDEVMAIFTSSYKTGYKIKKVDEKVGRVWVEGPYGDNIVNILEVYKE
ncbi:MAG: hypothetical protein IKU00_04585 [Bacteroidales bacterium]|nr:hypothetical protein [Bacteroidales bacterium]